MLRNNSKVRGAIKKFSRKRRKQNVQFIGLKGYTHRQRTKIINDVLVPKIRKELGKNLIAIAADGSYARNEDTDFSDIELMIFVKDSKKLPRGFGKILDGILIDGLFTIEDDYYKNTLEPNEWWFISGSDTLKPITNPHFIKKVQKYKVKNLSAKCLKHSKNLLIEIQESFGKLFNVIKKKNRDNLFPVLADAVMQVLKLMTFINETPYKTLGSFITQARKFKLKPEGFNEFIDIIVDGSYRDLEKLEQRATQLLVGIEDHFKKKFGENIYDSDLSTITKKK